MVVPGIPQAQLHLRISCLLAGFPHNSSATQRLDGLFELSSHYLRIKLTVLSLAMDIGVDIRFPAPDARADGDRYALERNP
jgi:hypothetical protein